MTRDQLLVTVSIAERTQMEEDKRKENDKHLLVSLNKAFTTGPPVQLSYGTIRSWTDNFNSDKIIGRREYGNNVFYEGYIVCETDRFDVTSSKDLLPANRRRVVVKKMSIESTVKFEIAAMSTLGYSYPGLIRLLGYSIPAKGEGRGENYQHLSEIYFVYEHARKGDLFQFIRNNGEQLSFHHRIHLMCEIARGVDYIHKYETSTAFHNDIKSSNIVLTGDLQPKLIDCFLDRYFTSEVCEDGMPLGHLGYMCRQNDICNFGIVLYEILTGEDYGVVNRDGDVRFELDTVDDLTPDPRAGDWPVECVQSLIGLIKDCIKREKKNVNMTLVLRQLMSIMKQFCNHSEREKILIRENRVLQERFAQICDEHELDDKIAESEEKRGCPCCHEVYKLSEGVVCTNDFERHFICFDCFSCQVKATCNDLALFRSNGCCIVCCFCQAQKPPFIARFDDYLVCKVCSNTDIDSMMAFLEVGKRATKELADAAAEGKIAQIREKEQEKRLQEVAKMLSDERERKKQLIEFHRQRIINRILTARCPHCEGAFLDWKNCDAVMHGPTEVGSPEFGCKKYFCPWCLGKCSSNDDAHQHIRENRCGRVDKEENFRKVQAISRAKKIIEYLEENIIASEGGDELRREIIHAMCEVDLAPIGIGAELLPPHLRVA